MLSGSKNRVPVPKDAQLGPTLVGTTRLTTRDPADLSGVRVAMRDEKAMSKPRRLGD